MAISQQQIHSLTIEKLKSIKNFSLSLDGASITALLGPNGNGKSTVLHALACAFQPSSSGENYRFSNFFLPHPDALWQGSSLKIMHSYRDVQTVHDRVEKSYQKNSDRWSPRYEDRPKRDIFYIGIDKMVPLIESEKTQVRINYQTEHHSDILILKVLEKASFILNKPYSNYNIHRAGSNKNFMGVEVNGLQYSALTMSAGEQKIFLLLDKLFKAPKHALLLIDELDLLLHDIALKKLIKVMKERADEKSLQIIFTTHRESVLELSNIINIRHMVNTPNQTLCFNETKPDAINRLTGIQPRPLEIFVEDDLAKTIIEKIASQLHIKRYLSIEQYGAATNCFTIAAGLLLSGEECEHSLFVLDGDVYRSLPEKHARINATITGNDEQATVIRQKISEKISEFSLPEGIKPEKYLHQIIISTNPNENEDYREIIEVARDIQAVNDDHYFINDIIERIGMNRSVGLAKIMDLISQSPEWNDYIYNIHIWLSDKVALVREQES